MAPVYIGRPDYQDILTRRTYAPFFLYNGCESTTNHEAGGEAMEKIIEFRKYPLDLVLDKLLMDKTTGKPIIWATNSYSEFGETYCDRFTITLGALQGINPVLIQPRAFKALETQQQRTKSKAEVFTPSWIVNKMINHLDEEWFGRPEVFNIEDEKSWKTNPQKIDFKGKKWKDYVDQTVLEITCGEAPFIVSRYNASSGEIIPIEDRIGILDRKLRVVTENTDNEEDWLKWTKRAFESVYGYEYQGDNLLIGRINLLMTFLDYYRSVWKKDADKSLLTAITNIITWNFWQMDGLNGTVPLGVPQPLIEQMTLFDFEEEQEEKAPLCKVRKWRAKKTILHKEIETKEGSDMGKKKWDIILGNPPYQEESKSNNQAKPVYNLFMEEAFKVGKTVELITPARFLTNQGATPKQWNNKMLNDDHYQILDFYPKSSTVFPNVDIKGGVIISLHDNKRTTEPIGTFIPFKELASIYDKVKSITPPERGNLGDWVFSPDSYRFSDDLFAERPELVGRTDKAHAKAVSSSVFSRYPEIFSDEAPSGNDSYIKIYGRENSQRVSKWTKRKYVAPHENLDKWKIFVPGANGTGAIGEILSTPVIGQPVIGHNQTFVSIGTLDTEFEAQALLKYVKSKFGRALLGIMKTTQNNQSKSTWSKIPLQNFTPNSDIDWSKSIPEIDQQLYKKYGLSPEEIEFIETHVKEME